MSRAAKPGCLQPLPLTSGYGGVIRACARRSKSTAVRGSCSSPSATYLIGFCSVPTLQNQYSNFLQLAKVPLGFISLLVTFGERQIYKNEKTHRMDWQYEIPWHFSYLLWPFWRKYGETVSIRLEVSCSVNVSLRRIFCTKEQRTFIKRISCKTYIKYSCTVVCVCSV